MSDNLLQEYNEFSYTLEELNEDGKPKKFKLKGIFQKSDTPNGNKRVYPRPVLEGAVESVSSIVNEGRMLGELDHPDDAKIHLDKVSHKVTKLYMNTDGTVIGEAEVLNTPAGKILESLLQSGVKLGISSRGFGSTKEASNGLHEVQKDYKLVTFDIVSDPSTPGAFPSAVYEHNENKSSSSVNESGVTTLGYALEDILSEEIEIKREHKELICSDNNNRYYIVEGEKDSYGTLNFHASHDYHILVKNENLEERIAINSDNIKLFEDVYGNKVTNRVLSKIEELGYNSKTFFANKKEDL